MLRINSKQRNLIIWNARCRFYSLSVLLPAEIRVVRTLMQLDSVSWFASEKREGGGETSTESRPSHRQRVLIFRQFYPPGNKSEPLPSRQVFTRPAAARKSKRWWKELGRARLGPVNLSVCFREYSASAILYSSVGLSRGDSRRMRTAGRICPSFMGVVGIIQHYICGFPKPFFPSAQHKASELTS